MPNTKSAGKRMRSNEKKRLRNQATLSELKTLDKRLHTLTNDFEQAEKVVKLMVSRYDRAVSRGVVPRGRADRKKSRLAKFLAKLQKK